MVRIDMPLPKNCEDCKLCVSIMRGFGICKVCGYTKKPVDLCYFKREKDCPLKK